MGRTEKALRMLRLLSCRGRISRKELAELLGESERNILSLKEEIVQSGISINSYRGIYGGYEINSDEVIFSRNLNSTDEKLIRQLYSLLIHDNTIVDNEKFAEILENIIIDFNQQGHDVIEVYDSTHLAIPKKILERYYHLCEEAISHNKVIEFDYEKTNGTMSTVRIEPYELISYRNGWYIKGMNKLVMKTYKLNRIKRLEVTNIPFIKNNDYISKEDKSFNLEKIKVKLIITNRNDIKEYIYSNDQHIEEMNDNVFVMTASMPEYTAYALAKNLGSACEIVEPIELKQKVIDDAKKILELYENRNE